MDASDFIRKKHTSCNGCFFQKLHRVTCMDEGNRELVNALFSTFGNCYAAYPYIYILKDLPQRNNELRYKRMKPKQNEPLPHVMEIYRPHRHFEEKDHRIEI
jgi:heterodisulfide reductase subunit B